jgi:hypothetical protein
MDIEASISMYSAKKRKEMERKLSALKDNYKWLLEDISRLKEQDSVKKSMDSMKKELDYLENYSKIHINNICQILLEDGFIIKNGDEERGVYQLSEYGKIASNINEIHPLIAANMILKTNWFEHYNVNQLISLFSIFTDINVPEDFKRTNICNEQSFCNDLFLKKIKEISQMAYDYEKRELALGLYTGIDYDKVISYELLEEMSGWIACENKESCKYFIQTVLTNRGISIGDFTKAILKIAVITNEIIGVCEMIGDLGVGLLYKLKMVDSLILKYVATSQSLYV